MGAGDNATFAETDRDAYYNDDATAVLVTIGDGETAPTAASATLSEDKTATIADNHGWMGKRYMDPAGGDMYEAVVYSNIEATMGDKFGQVGVETAAAGRQAPLQTTRSGSGGTIDTSDLSACR